MRKTLLSDGSIEPDSKDEEDDNDLDDQDEDDTDEDDEEEEDEKDDKDENASADGSIDPDSMVSRWLTWLCIAEAIVIGCQEKDIVVKRKKEYLIARMLAVSILVQQSYKSFDPSLPAGGNAIETYDKQKTFQNNSQQSKAY